MLYVLAGRTGSAKSTLALNIVRRVALEDTAVLLAKLEESGMEAVWRIHAAASQVPLSTLLDAGKRDPATEIKLADGWNLLNELPIRITTERRLRAFEQVAQQHAADSGGLIVIDQLSMIDVDDAEVGYQQANQGF